MTDKEIGNTPLPYKGMNIRDEIASRVFPTIIDLVAKSSDYRSFDNPDAITVSVNFTLVYTEALITKLNQRREK